MILSFIHEMIQSVHLFSILSIMHLYLFKMLGCRPPLSYWPLQTIRSKINKDDGKFKEEKPSTFFFKGQQ